MTSSSQSRRVCIVAATSAMAEHTARLLAARGDHLHLVGRDRDRLMVIANDLRNRGAVGVGVTVCDLAGLADPDGLLDGVARDLGGLDAVLMFQGVLGTQDQVETSTVAARQVFDLNFTGPAELALASARRLQESTHPCPVVLAIGSVAGDRGRGSNYGYGAAKAGLAVLMQGMNHRFARKESRVRAVVIKPGFVDTPMTAAFKKGPLWAKPATVAAIIVAAMEKGGPIVYAPGFWRLIMLVIRVLPSTIMNRVNL